MESAKKLEVIKFLWAGIFNEYYSSILLINEGGEIRRPAGPVYLADVCPFVDERWMQAFLSRRIEEDTGIPASLIKKKTQPLMATYNVYSRNFREEHSGVIIGRINESYVTKVGASFYDTAALARLIKEKRISRAQEIIILRFLSSRDCRNKDSNEFARPKLEAKHR